MVCLWTLSTHTHTHTSIYSGGRFFKNVKLKRQQKNVSVQLFVRLTWSPWKH